MGLVASRCWCCPCPRRSERSVRLLDLEAPSEGSVNGTSLIVTGAGRDAAQPGSGSGPNLRPLAPGTWSNKRDRELYRAKGSSINYRMLLPERFEVDVDKRYILDKATFGEGGYGKVFVATDRECADRRVAVKRVTKTNNVEQTQAFRDEISIMKELDHPNICKLLETFEKGRHIFFVMEFCPGGELFDRILKQGHISEAVTSEVVSQVGAALCYSHGRSIAHRDIKPENIMFCNEVADDNSVKVIDWGLGISFAGGEVMRTAVGSVTYAAPEVMRCRNLLAYTEECDVWSLGVVTYVMLCGKPPFWGSAQQHSQRAMAETYPITGELWDAISVPAKDFVRGMLRADPKQRFTIQQVISHPWLVDTSPVQSPDRVQSIEILSNLRQFSNNKKFIAFASTAVARQLDHSELRSIHQVFADMDKDMDGVLSLEEVSEGFKTIFGEYSEEYQKVEETFRSLDSDGSGSIDYTEFCAAGLGHHAMDKADAVWAAFKTFDLDNNGCLSRAEIQAVVENVDLQREWSEQVLSDTVERILKRFDRDGDGEICFDEFMQLMKDAWRNKQGFTFSPTFSPEDGSPSEQESIQALFETSPAQAYDILRDSFALSPRAKTLQTF